MKTTRRNFLGMLASFFAYALGGSFRAVAATSDSARLIYKLTILVSDRPAAALLGRAYLDATPEESAPDKLADLICRSSPDVRRQVMESVPGTRRDLLGTLIAEDFEKDQTVGIHGWVLARTEARLFALVATQPAGR